MFLALTVVGVDLARLAFTATEVQAVADVAATAGARSLFESAFNGGTGDAVADALTVAAQNRIDGRVASNGNGIQVIPVVGNYDFGTNTFSEGVSPQNAVRATARATVTNLVAAAIEVPQTMVEKIALATLAGPASGCAPPVGCGANDWACYCSSGSAPCLPISAPDCQFRNDQLPTLRVSNAGNDTAAWTGFQSGHSTVEVRPFLDQGPCDPPGSSSVPGDQNAGFVIDVNNGIASSGINNVFDLTRCIFENNLGCADTDNDGKIDGPGGTIFTIPVFDLDPCETNPTGLQEVVGFATIKITGVVIDGSTKTIDLQTIARNSGTETRLGGACFGTNCGTLLAR